jgi:hypothetical protein
MLTLEPFSNLFHKSPAIICIRKGIIWYKEFGENMINSWHIYPYSLNHNKNNDELELSFHVKKKQFIKKFIYKSLYYPLKIYIDFF